MSTNSREKLVRQLSKRYPFGIPRTELKKATGGLLDPRTQANRDFQNKGQEIERVKIGKKIVYSVDAVVDAVFLVKKKSKLL